MGICSKGAISLTGISLILTTFCPFHCCLRGLGDAYRFMDLLRFLLLRRSNWSSSEDEEEDVESLLWMACLRLKKQTNKQHVTCSDKQPGADFFLSFFHSLQEQLPSQDLDSVRKGKGQVSSYSTTTHPHNHTHTHTSEG